MKISDRDKKLILFVLFVAIIALPIFLFIKPKNAETAALEAQLVDLNERYNYLKDLSAKQPEYEQKIVELNAERDAMISDYAGGVLFENTVLFLRECEIHFDEKFRAVTMAFAADEETEITEASVVDGEYVDGLTAIKATTTIDYNGHYDEIKEFINYIFNYKDKMVLSGVTMELDEETNLVKGVVVLDQYAISGNGKEVKTREIPDMLHGTNRLFKLMLDEEGNVKDYWRSIGVTDFADEEAQTENEELTGVDL